MKKIFTLFLLIIIFDSVTAQNSETQNASDTTKYVYCQIVGTGKFLSNKVTIEIDFGQFRSIWTDNRLKDPATGEKIVFNGMIDALNYMGKLGWLFVQAYAFSPGGNNPNVYHFLMKKPKWIIDAEDKDPHK